MALFSRTADTEESTPPLRPKMTRSLPNCAFNSATVESTNDAALHSCLDPQISTTKFFNSCLPCKVWKTSGWNCTAQTGCVVDAKAALTTSAVEPITLKSLGMAVIVFLKPDSVIKFLTVNESDQKAQIFYVVTDHKLTDEEIAQARSRK